MKCPECGHEWKDERIVDGGKKSRRKISPEAQANMQAGREKFKNSGKSRKDRV